MTVLAHAGHWAVSLLYVAPVFVLVGFLALQAWRDRRRDPTHRRDEASNP